MLAILMSLFGVHLIFDQLLMQKLCVRYFTKYILGKFGNSPVIKVDTLCYLFQTMHFGFIW